MSSQHRIVYTRDIVCFGSVGVLVMPHQVLVNEFLPVFPADAAMYPKLGLDVREDTLKAVVCVRDVEIRLNDI